MKESFADGSVGARVRLMVRGGCLSVRGSEMMTWKNDDCRCSCGLVETEMHVLFECTLYEEERKRWRGAVGYLKDGNDTAYKRWSCHSELKLLCKLCRTSPPPAMGARFTVFLGKPAMRTRWMAGAVAHKSG